MTSVDVIVVCAGPTGLMTAAELELGGARPRIDDSARQITEYRVGNVFFAGDAAHIHLPLAGQGLNTGLGDAVDLGWKLAGAVRGWAPAGLLDTYASERHPVGARVRADTQTRGLLMDWADTGNPDLAAARVCCTPGPEPLETALRSWFGAPG